MNCEQCQQLLPDYILDLLTPERAAEVEWHVFGRADDISSGRCESCCLQLAQGQEAVASLAMTLPPESPPARIKQTLLQQVRHERLNERRTRTVLERPEVSRSLPESKPVSRRHSHRWALLPYAAAAVCAALAGVAVVRWSDHQAGTRAALVREFEEKLENARQSFPTQQITLAALDPLDDPSRIGGYVIWDRVASHVHVFVFDLRPPAKGHAYRFWYLDRSEQWIPGGDLGSTGDGVYGAVLDAPPNETVVVRGVITEEPLGADAAAPPQEAMRLSADLAVPTAGSR
jgi:hypothetical protein